MRLGRCPAHDRPCEHRAVTGIRILVPDDAAEITDLLVAHREFLAPWEPLRSDDWFELTTQRSLLVEAVREHDAGRRVPWGITTDDGVLVGRITLNDIVRGAFESAHLGYWVCPPWAGAGMASRATALAIAAAFGEYGLHRLQAGTLLHNVASHKVLQRNGFIRFGQAPRYLRIAGQWQDHLLFQRLAEEG